MMNEQLRKGLTEMSHMDNKWSLVSLEAVATAVIKKETSFLRHTKGTCEHRKLGSAMHQQCSCNCLPE